MESTYLARYNSSVQALQAARSASTDTEAEDDVEGTLQGHLARLLACCQCLPNSIESAIWTSYKEVGKVSDQVEEDAAIALLVNPTYYKIEGIATTKSKQRKRKAPAHLHLGDRLYAERVIRMDAFQGTLSREEAKHVARSLATQQRGWGTGRRGRGRGRSSKPGKGMPLESMDDKALDPPETSPERERSMNDLAPNLSSPNKRKRTAEVMAPRRRGTGRGRGRRHTDSGQGRGSSTEDLTQDVPVIVQVPRRSLRQLPWKGVLNDSDSSQNGQSDAANSDSDPFTPTVVRQRRVRPLR